MKPRDRELLLQRFVDGELDDDGCREALALIKSDPAALDLYCDYAEIDAGMRYLTSGPAFLWSSRNNMIEQCRQQSMRRHRLTALAVAAVALVAIAFLLQQFLAPRPPVATFHTSRDSAIEIVHSEESGRAKPDALEVGSRMILKEGVVEFAYASGVRSIVEGPAELTIVDEGSLLLSHGTGWFHVPEDAVGFRVSTSMLEVVDLGTEFGLVSERRSAHEIHVIRGSVRATSRKRPAEERILKAGEAAKVDPVGRLESIAVKTDSFLRELPEFAGIVDLRLNDAQRGLRTSTTPPLDRNRLHDVPDGRWGLATANHQANACRNRELWVSRQDLGEDPPPLVVTLSGLIPGKSYEFSAVRPVDEFRPWGGFLASLGDGPLRTYSHRDGEPTGTPPYGDYQERRVVIGTAVADRRGTVRVRFGHSRDDYSRSYISAIGVRASAPQP